MVILIATPDHRVAIERCLEADHFQTQQYQSQGFLMILDAGEMLANLLVRGQPNVTRFDQIVGSLIGTAKMKSPSGRVRLFGEMVSLLWSKNHDLAGAAKLEELWNGVIDRYNVPLLCTYELNDLHSQAPRALPAVLADSHSHSLVL